MIGLTDTMDDTDTDNFGGLRDDIDGQVSTRKIQTGGRVNFPDRMLGYIGCSKGDKIIIGAEDGQLVIKRADIDALGVTNVMQGTLMALEEYHNDE
jgi:bifunctional DNA-binding transcriptional regulator/antitoxin component of YhaV-PrlF toxin-antitoxin module